MTDAGPYPILRDRETCKWITCNEPTAFGSDYCTDHTDDVVLSGGIDG